MKRRLSIFIYLICAFQMSHAQLVEVDSITVCGSMQVELYANLVTGSFSNVVLTDDVHSSVIPMGFGFNFYDSIYSHLVISSNNYVTFDTTKASSYSNWTITSTAPNVAMVPNNSILSPFQDVNPASTFPIYYGTVGQAPNRIFVVTFCELPMYSCTNLKFTSQLLLYEGSNTIEMHIFSKPTCTQWNNGYAIQGVIDSTGSNSTFVPGRNFPDVWSAQREGWQFTLDSSGQYIVQSIPFGPVPPQLISGNPIEWYNQSNQLIGTGDSISFLAYQDSYVYAKTVFCSPQSFYTDTVFFVQRIPFTLLQTEPTCHGGTNGLITISPLISDSLWSYVWSTTDTTTSISNLSSGWYYFTIADNAGCEAQDSLFLDQPSMPSINLTVSGNQIFCNVLASYYQWYLDGVPIPNSNWSTITVTQSGMYSVEITTASGCVYSSAQLVYNIGMEESEVSEFLIYPNPSNGVVNISSAKSGLSIRSVVVHDILGQRVMEFDLAKRETEFQIDLSELSRGSYIIYVSDGETQTAQRVVLSN